VASQVLDAVVNIPHDRLHRSELGGHPLLGYSEELGLGLVQDLTRILVLRVCLRLDVLASVDELAEEGLVPHDLGVLGRVAGRWHR